MEAPVDILLVEDDPDDIALTLHIFGQDKVIGRVEVVRDGVEALDFIFGQGADHDSDVPLPDGYGPRLILLDLKLPRLNGFEVLRKLKTDERTKRIPVVVLTSSRRERDVTESYRLGVNSYVVKPLNFEDFETMVRQLGAYWLMLNEGPP
jgi:two-component system response regulator